MIRTGTANPTAVGSAGLADNLSLRCLSPPDADAAWSVPSMSPRPTLATCMSCDVDDSPGPGAPVENAGGIGDWVAAFEARCPALPLRINHRLRGQVIEIAAPAFFLSR
jgi:hypothetical protein